ncbi:MAG: GNAT family N-acetyltransferase [Chitinophagaceae bacterium]
MLIAKQVSTQNELQQILDLQSLYLRGARSAEEEKEQGFLTVQHSFDALQQMHSIEPSIIVKDGDTLAGYALVMPKACSTIVPELLSLFEDLEKLDYKGKPLQDYSFYVMGQICVAEAYRGLGVFAMLYQKHKEILQPHYDFIITEVATRNTRSMRAHQRVGFKQIHVHKNDWDEWAIVLWDWQ